MLPVEWIPVPMVLNLLNTHWNELPGFGKHYWRPNYELSGAPRYVYCRFMAADCVLSVPDVMRRKSQG